MKLHKHLKFVVLILPHPSALYVFVFTFQPGICLKTLRLDNTIFLALVI